MATTSLVKLVILCVACLISSSSIINAYVIEVGSGTEECFVEYVKTKRTAFLRIAVLTDETQDSSIRLKAFGPFTLPPEEDMVDKKFFNQLVTTKFSEDNQDVQHDGFNFDTEHRGGWYKYCLDNRHGNQAKLVDFMTSHGLTNEDEEGHEDVAESKQKADHVRTVKRSLHQIASKLNKIKNEQNYYTRREKRHMLTIKSNQSRLFWYTIGEIMTLAALYGGQMYFLRQWFADRMGGGGAGGVKSRQWA